MPKRIKHVGHEVAAARRLIYRILGRRHRLDRHLQRARNGSLQSFLRRGRDRVGRDRRGDRGSGADETAPLRKRRLEWGVMRRFGIASSRRWREGREDLA